MTAQIIQMQPRRGPLNEEAPDILVPALTALRKCQTAFDVAVFVQGVPDHLLPLITWVASRRPIYPRVVVRTLVKVCGKRFLVERLGRARALSVLGSFEGDEL